MTNRSKGCVVILFLIFLLSCGGRAEVVSRMLLGTVVTITIADKDDNSAELFNLAFNEIEKVQRDFSLYSNDSEISMINRKGYPGPLKVSNDLFFLIKSSIDVSEKTEGAFDLTWASSGKLWDFSAEEFTPPDDAKIKSVLPLISYKNIRIDESSNSIRFLKKDTKIGLGAIAKGFAVKKAVSALKSRGVKGAIVACAGDIQVIGDYNGRRWKAGIRDPRGSSVIATFLMDDGEAVSTSGDYERFRIVNGRRYHHIIDPSTGYPADSGLISVTVFSHDPLVSDAYSTAFFVSGIDRTKRTLMTMTDISVVLVDENMTVHVSTNIKGKLQFREDLKVIYF